jgi:hypothetical protein
MRHHHGAFRNIFAGMGTFFWRQSALIVVRRDVLGQLGVCALGQTA